MHSEPIDDDDDDVIIIEDVDMDISNSPESSPQRNRNVVPPVIHQTTIDLTRINSAAIPATSTIDLTVTKC